MNIKPSQFEPKDAPNIALFPEDARKQRYFNRELSWLAFNYRVLQEASNPKVPVLERLKFLAICASNLDEFYMVRVAGLKDLVRHDIAQPSADGMSPREQLDAINLLARQLIQDQQLCWLDVVEELSEEGLHVVKPDRLDEEDIRALKRYFNREVFPTLTPIAVDPAHPFPFIPNLGITLLCQLGAPGNDDSRLALIPFPPKMPRFLTLREQGNGEQRLIMLEDAITLFFQLLFPGMELRDHTLFRVIRDSDLDLEEEAEDLVRSFEKAVKERRRGRVIRVKLLAGTSAHFIRFLKEKLNVDTDELHEVEGIIGMASVGELYGCDRPDLKFVPFNVRFPERIHDFDGNCFAAIKAKDIVVHHPYESFDVVIRFLEQAAADPKVVSIKQTLYRTSKDSPIVRALIEAAENGKSVTALVELKARFDEEANIRWARDMERAGVQVVYGFVDMKTHAKISLITRREHSRLQSYAHFGTGNYHPTTAQFYTDLSFFTCDSTLCRDAAQVFNFITGYAKPAKLKKLTISPLLLRKRLYALIDEEIAHARAGRPATIWAKMNNLIDIEMIEKLYDASMAGVQIDLVIRGICGLRPGVKGMSENIRVKSIVGRFLEHARIYCFGAGHPLPSPEAQVFISSADWMTRNLSHRVEVMVPIENPTVHAQILDQIMVANLKDDRQSWMLREDGSYVRVRPRGKGFNAHHYFMHNPSLSGRGRALQQADSTPLRIRSNRRGGER